MILLKMSYFTFNNNNTLTKTTSSIKYLKYLRNDAFVKSNKSKYNC